MKIVLFDTKSYDRLHFDEANRKYGYDIVYHDASLNRNTAILAKGADVVCPFVNCIVDKAVVDILKEDGVKLIAMRSAGFNNVDYRYALSQGIPVVRVPAYSPHAVAEHSFALLLALVRKLTHAYVRTREFNFSLSGLVGMDLYGKTMGIVGMGHIGMRTAEIAAAFGMGVIYTTRSRKEEAEEKGFKPVDLDTLLSQSDYISLHVPLTPETENMINRNTLGKMKKSAILINTARGGLIDEEALAEALREKRIAGAGLDVLREEPPRHGSPLIELPECIITPHIAWSAKETRMRLMNCTLDNLVSFMIGTPKNIIS